MNLVCRGPADLLSQLIEDVLGIALEVEMIRRLGLERGGVPADADMRLTMGEDRCALRGGLRCSGSARDTISRTTEEG